MIRLSFAALCALFVVPTPLTAAPDASPTPRSTQRTVSAFRDCFIANQEKAGRPWAYVLNGSGGTFSTVPTASGDSPYYLRVRDGGASRQIELTGEAPPGPTPAVATAVEACAR